jgi:hypothetical protein
LISHVTEGRGLSVTNINDLGAESLRREQSHKISLEIEDFTFLSCALRLDFNSAAADCDAPVEAGGHLVHDILEHRDCNGHPAGFYR